MSLRNMGTGQALTGSATGTPAEVDLTAGGNGASACEYLYLRNLDATKSLLFSRDGGITYQTLGPGDAFTWYGRLFSLLLKSSSGTVAWEAWAGYSRSPVLLQMDLERRVLGLEESAPGYQTQVARQPTTTSAETIRKIYVRPGGDDVTGAGTLDRPFASLPRAVCAVPLFIYGERWVIDITGVTAAHDGGVQLPPWHSPHTVRGISAGLPYPAFHVDAAVSIIAVPSEVYTFTASDISSNVTDSVTQLRTITLSGTPLTAGAHVGAMLVNKGVNGQVGVIVANTASVLTVASTDSFATGPYAITRPGAEIRNSDAGSSAPALRASGVGASLFLGGVKLSLANGGASATNALYLAMPGQFRGHLLELPGIFTGGGSVVPVFFGCWMRGINSVLFARYASGWNISRSFFDAAKFFSSGGTGQHTTFNACHFKSCTDLGHRSVAASEEATGGFTIRNSLIESSVGHGVAYYGGLPSLVKRTRINSSVSAGVYAARRGSIDLDQVVGTGNGGVGLEVTHGAEAQVTDSSTTVTGSGGDLKVGTKSARTWSNFFSNSPIKSENDFDASSGTGSRVWAP